MHIPPIASSGFCEVLVTCDLNIALLWNSQRARPIPSSTIVAMADTVEHPESSKHHWEEKSIVMNSDTWWEKGKKSWDEIWYNISQNLTQINIIKSPYILQ